jgi:hypothetical protein
MRGRVGVGNNPAQPPADNPAGLYDHCPEGLIASLNRKPEHVVCDRHKAGRLGAGRLDEVRILRRGAAASDAATSPASRARRVFENSMDIAFLPVRSCRTERARPIAEQRAMVSNRRMKFDRI